MNYTAALSAALAQVGIEYPGPFTADGNIHRFKAKGDAEANCTYSLHDHGDLVVGKWWCWKRQINGVFCSKDQRTMGPEERRKFREAVASAEQARAAQEKEAADKAQARCRTLFSAPQVENHPYLARKGVVAYGRAVESTDLLTIGWLALPMVDAEGVMHSAQFIADDGVKRFLLGGRVKGYFIQIPGPAESPLIICEGYATGCSIKMATGWEVVCATSCGNLFHVAQSMRKLYPDRAIVLAADNDQFTNSPPNPGLTEAKKAAAAVKALLAYPEFADEALEEKPTDFNDLHRLDGLGAVKAQIMVAFPDDSVLKLLQVRRFDPMRAPPPLRPIYTLQGEVVCTPGNLSIITSQIKSGKSALVGAMMASAMPHEAEGLDFLGFASQNPSGKALLHFDTEQTPDDHWFEINRALRRAGLEKPPDWFYSWCLSGVAFKRAWQCIQTAMEEKAQEHSGLHSVLIDGDGDLVSDVNEQAECNDFISRLFDRAIHYDTHINGVLHWNPGSDVKGRGHLGSQLERKCESVICLAKNCTSTEIYSEKMRRAPIPKGKGIHFAWSEEKKMHITVQETAETSNKTVRGPSYEIEELAQLLSKHSLSGFDWLNAAKDKMGMCRASFFNFKGKLVSQGRVSIDPISGNWRLEIKS